MPNGEKLLAALCGLFHSSVSELGSFEPVTKFEMPEDYRNLLAHEEHMTVTVEAFHGCLVDVGVLGRVRAEDTYAREIVLKRQTDGAVVQYGLMRVHLSLLAPPVRAAIEEEHTPLGRILIEHNVLRRIQLLALYRVRTASLLRRLLATEQEVTFGRAARIDVDGEPAVEVIEIVAPVDSRGGDWLIIPPICK